MMPELEAGESEEAGDADTLFPSRTPPPVELLAVFHGTEMDGPFISSVNPRRCFRWCLRAKTLAKIARVRFPF